jgi:hypothetical protein
MYNQDNFSTGTPIIVMSPVMANLTDSDPSFMKGLVEAVISNENFSKTIKEKVEGLIQETIVRNKIDHLIHKSDPFDPIYLSKLEADKISATDIQNISALFSIRDNSPNIEFNDGLDD